MSLNNVLFFLFLIVVCKHDSDCLKGDICYIDTVVKNTGTKNNPVYSNFPQTEGLCQSKYFSLNI